MNWLLTDDEFAAAAEAVRDGRVTEPLYLFLARLVSAVARSGTVSPILAPGGQWNDEGIADTLHDWLSERLLVDGLLRAFDAAAGPRALSRYLERALRNWLISKGRGRTAPRLVPRTPQLLRQGDRYHCHIKTGSARDDGWGLDAWGEGEKSLWQGTDEELIRAAFALGEFALVRFVPTAQKADPVISNADLDRLIGGLFESTQHLLTLRQFEAVLRGRFGFAFGEGEISLDAEAELAPSGDTDPLTDMAVEDAAREALAEMSGRQLAIFLDRVYEGSTLDELARRHGVSRSTADNELRRAGQAIDRHADSEANRMLVLEKLVELASREDDG